MNMKHLDSIDHTDPLWEEGRSYQLVCGLDVPANTVVRSYNFNSRKNNRFLPFRLEGATPAPLLEGDLAWFLDPHTGEWVWEAFLGEWWWEKTRNTCGTGQPKSSLHAQRIGAALVGLKRSDATREKHRISALARERRACAHCGKVCAPHTLHRWHNDNCKLRPSH